MTPTWTIERGVDEDAEAIMSLLEGIFAEYGCQLDPIIDSVAHYRPQTRYWDHGGAFFVARDRERRLIGTVAVHPNDAPATGQVRTMYLARTWRGSGLAQELMRRVLSWCADHALSRLELWSDTRFTRGHAFYRRLGFTQTERRRLLHDINDTEEFHFEADIAALTRA